MATTTSVSDIITLVRDVGEFRSTQISDDLLERWIGLSLSRLYDILLDRDPERYSHSINLLIMSGTQEYTLPPDYYRLQAIDIADDDKYYALRRLSLQDRNSLTSVSDKKDLRYEIRDSQLYLWPTPDFNGGIRLIYAPTFSLAATSFDTINNWQDYIAFDVAVKAAMRIAEDPTHYRVERDRLLSSITGKTVKADHAGPKTVADRYRNIGNSRRGVRRW